MLRAREYLEIKLQQSNSYHHVLTSSNYTSNIEIKETMFIVGVYPRITWKECSFGTFKDCYIQQVSDALMARCA